MESYIKGQVECYDDDYSQIKKLFKFICDGNIDKVKKTCEALEAPSITSDRLIELFEEEEYQIYIESLEYKIQKPDAIEFTGTCGSSGLDFLIDLIKDLGPNVHEINATYEHDEEPDEEEWPIRISFSEDCLYQNGEKVAVQVSSDRDGFYSEKIKPEKSIFLKEACLLFLSSDISAEDAIKFVQQLDDVLRICHVGFRDKRVKDASRLYLEYKDYIESDEICELLINYFIKSIKFMSDREEVYAIQGTYNQMIKLTAFLLEKLDEKDEVWCKHDSVNWMVKYIKFDEDDLVG